MEEQHEIIAQTASIQWRVVRTSDGSWWYEGFNGTLGYITDSRTFNTSVIPSYEHFRVWLVSEIRRVQQ